MSVRTHDLKTWPQFFEQVWDGEKTFEIRIDDRGYQKHDVVVLREWDRNLPCDCAPPAGTRYEHRTDCAKYSGRTVTATIGCVVASTPPKGSQRGFNGMGYVVFSLCDPEKVDEPRPGMPSPAEAMRRVAGLAHLEAVEP